MFVFRFGETVATFDESSKNTILDYAVKVNKLKEDDRIILYQGQNYSVTGSVISSISVLSFEILGMSIKRKTICT